MKHRWWFVCLWLLWGSPAHAEITCEVSASSTAFGNYNPAATQDVQVTGNINVSCTRSGLLDLTPSISYTIALSAGQSNNYTVRYMSYLSSHLNYDLYRNSARTLIWGNGTGGSSTQAGTINFPLLDLISTTQDQDHTVYGTLFKNQYVRPGAYTDSITVTVTY